MHRISLSGKMWYVFGCMFTAAPSSKCLLRIADVTHTSAKQILMGDSIGDLQMSAGLKHNVQLTIGFCNHDKDIWLEKYAELFDVVVLDDSPMDFPNLVLCGVA